MGGAGRTVYVRGRDDENVQSKVDCRDDADEDEDDW